MGYKKLFFISLAPLIIISCAENKLSESTKADLTDIQWNLNEILGYAITPDSSISKDIFLFLKSEDSIFYGFGGCNNFNGKYFIEQDGKIDFSDEIAVTMMMCPNIIIEQDFIDVLKKSDGFIIKGNSLLLNLGHSTLARFYKLL